LASAFYFRVCRVFLVSLFVVAFRQFFLGIDPGGLAHLDHLQALSGRSGGLRRCRSCRGRSDSRGGPCEYPPASSGTDPLDVREVIDRFEGAILGAVIDDSLSLQRSDALQRVELFFGRGVDIDRRHCTTQQRKQQSYQQKQSFISSLRKLNDRSIA